MVTCSSVHLGILLFSLLLLPLTRLQCCLHLGIHSVLCAFACRCDCFFYIYILLIKFRGMVIGGRVYNSSAATCLL